MNNFKFHTPTQIFFGKDQIKSLPSLVSGKRVLLVYGYSAIKKMGLYDKVVEILKDEGCTFFELSGVDPNPRLTSVEQGIQLTRKNNLDLVLAVGGGSAIDCAKAICLGHYYDGDAWELTLPFEGRRKVEPTKALPLGTFLTLSATGTEMNANAVISNKKLGIKAAISNPLVKPVFSILDPKYTYSVSPYQTGCGVSDIMSHIFEQYFSRTKCTFLQDTIAEALMRVCIRFGKTAIDIPTHYEARSSLMWASTLALNGLIGEGQDGDWATHQIEHAVATVNDMAHGAGLAIIFPHWMRYVLDNAEASDKFVNYGRNIWNLKGERREIELGAISKTAEFFSELGMPSKLSEVGIKKEDFKKIVERTFIGSPSTGSFMQLKFEDVMEILKMAF